MNLLNLVQELQTILEVSFGYFWNVLKSKQEWFDEKVVTVTPELMSEVQMLADVIAQIDANLKEKNKTQDDSAHKMGKSEAVVSRWITGFPNFT